LLRKRNETEAERRREQYVDRGAGTSLDRYSEDELEGRKTLLDGWQALITSGKRKRVLPVQWNPGFGHPVDILFANSMPAAGGEYEGGKLPDLFTVEMKDEAQRRAGQCY